MKFDITVQPIITKCLYITCTFLLQNLDTILLFHT